MSGILEIRRGSTGISLNDGEFYLNKGINAVQIGSGSAILTLLPINKTITGDIILSGNIYANNLTGSGALSSSLITTLSVGGIDAGITYTSATDYNTLFSDLLAAYQKPTLSGLALRYINSTLSIPKLEVGNSFTFNKVIVTSSLENPGTKYAETTSITASGLTTTYAASLGNLSNQNNIISLGSNVTLQRNTIGTASFDLNAYSSTGIKLDKLTLNIQYGFLSYLCATGSSINNNTNAQTMIDTNTISSSIIGNINWQTICTTDNNNSTKYTYIVYPNYYDDINTILQGYNDVTTAFTKVYNTGNNSYNFLLTNQYSISSNYYIYRSNAPGAFADGTILTIK